MVQETVFGSQKFMKCKANKNLPNSCHILNKAELSEQSTQ